MKSGSLDRRLKVQRAVYTTNSFNEKRKSWQEIMEVWANKRDVSDGERIGAQQVQAYITTRFQLRWSTLAATISPTDRLVCEGRVYEIFSVKEIDRRIGLEISAAARGEVELVEQPETVGAFSQDIDGGEGAAAAQGTVIVAASGSAGGQG